MNRQPLAKFSLREIDGDLRTYFTWSANALVPFDANATDRFLRKNQPAILKVARNLLQSTEHVPGPIYRGIILRHPVEVITPHTGLTYISFSTQRQVAEHFADVNGFGSEHIDVASQLGTHGYIIEYTPKITEVLFHYDLLSYLPYAEAFALLNMDGDKEVEFLQRQTEIIILQPTEPFFNITKK